MKNDITYNNPPDYYIIALFHSIIIPAIFFGLYQFYFYSDIPLFILSLIIGLPMELALFIREFIIKPKRVNINNDNIILIYRIKQQKIILWSDIVDVNTSELWKDTPFLNKLGTQGSVTTKDYPNGILLTLEIGKKIREVFFSLYNYYPSGFNEKEFRL